MSLDSPPSAPVIISYNNVVHTRAHQQSQRAIVAPTSPLLSALGGTMVLSCSLSGDVSAVIGCIKSKPQLWDPRDDLCFFLSLEFPSTTTAGKSWKMQ